MTSVDRELSPPGTALSPRQNLSAEERGLSVIAGVILGYVASRSRNSVAGVLGAAGTMLIARGVTGASPAKRLLGQAPDERAVATAAGWSSAAVVSRSVTVNAPRSAVFDRFLNFAVWPDFSENVLHAQDLGNGRWRWTVTDPGGPVTFDASITEQIDGKLVALESDPQTPVPINSRFTFKDAPHGGTEVHAVVAYRPPGGSLARYASKLTQREPGIQLRRDLKRFKSVIEAGEVATNAPQGKSPKA
jgi:uncharacterized membrane protein